MSQERENFEELSVADYQIDGNVFRAWSNQDGQLVFVVDETIDDYKPYVLLIMDEYGDRKWDDVLSNDFHVDLEDIRPKKENKYQKLDIEYDGLWYYSRLIDLYKSGQNLDTALADLYDFRDAAVRRAATERLVVASDTIEQSARTSLYAERSITTLQNRRKVLEQRLERRRSEIGREPTKESAAKILKTEAQLEKNAEKLERSKKRLENALRRSEIAREDAEVARAVLARRRPSNVDYNANINVQNDTENDVVLDENKYEAPETKVQVVDNLDTDSEKTLETSNITIPIPDYEITQETVQEEAEETEETEETKESSEIKLPVPDYEITPEYEEKNMPDTQDKEEVKPLLDQDPEILDEEIAFKPVAFDDIKPAEKNTAVEEPVVDKTPKYESDDANTYSDSVHHDVAEEPIAKPLSFSEKTTVSQSYEEETHTEYQEPEPVLNTIQSVEHPTTSDVDTTGQVSNTQYAKSDSTVRPAGPNAAVATNRPISPITGTNTKVKPVGEKSKPTLLYYLLLIILIALSVFTLWLYQKKNGGTVPFLGQNGEPEAITQPDVIAEPDVFIDSQPEPVVTPEPEPEVPVVVEPEPVQEEPIKVEYPNNDVLRAADPTEVVVESEESVLSRKDAYPVSRESQPVYVEERVTNVAAPDVIFDEDVISVPVLAPDYQDDEELYYNENGQDADYYQQSQEYYQPQETYQSEYYQEPQQAEYNEYVEDGGFVEENVDGGFVIESNDASDPETRRYLTVHDGGQYSVGYTETTY